MLVSLFRPLGLLCCFAFVCSAALSDDCEANRKRYNDSIPAVGPYWISNDTNQGERDIKATLHDISEVIASQEETLNGLVLTASNWNRTEGKMTANQKEVFFLQLAIDSVKLFHEEESVLTHRNYSYCDDVGNNTIEECEKFFQVMLNATQLVNSVIGVIQSEVQFVELDDGFSKDRNESDTFIFTSLRCIVNEYRSFMKLLNSINKNMCEALNSATPVKLRTKFRLYCNKSYDVESFNSDRKAGGGEVRKVMLITFATVGTLFLIVGLIGNSVLLLVFLRHKEMRTAPNLMIINLTISDFLNLFFSLFVYYSVQIRWNWGFSEIICKLYFLLCFTVIYVGVYSVVTVHIQRCVALKSISNPQAPQRSARRKLRFALMVIAVWVVSFLLSAYPASRTFINGDHCSFMKDKEAFRYIFKKVQFTIIFVVPCIVIIISTYVTVRLLNKSIPGERIGLEGLMKERVLSSRVVMALTLVYVVTFGTHNAIVFIKQFYPDLPKTVTRVTYILTFANPSFNPVALFVASRKFRRYMKKYLLFWKSSSDDNAKAVTNAANANVRNTRI